MSFLFTAFFGEFLPIPPAVQGYILVVVAALPMVIFGILPQAMVADVAECDAINTGENREGMFYAARTFSLFHMAGWRNNMNSEILKALSVITEEEHVILNGQTEIDRNLYTREKEMIIDAKKLLTHGKLIEVRPHTRFAHFPKHRHNYVEVIYMCAGTTTHIINGTEVVLREGDLLFLSQNAVQEILPAGEQDIAVNFIIQPEFFDTAFSMIDGDNSLLRNFLIGCLCNDDRYASFLLFRVSDILPVQNLVENMIWTIMNNQPNKRSINQTTMGLLFLQLLNYTDRLSAGENQYEQDFVIKVLSYIEEQYKDATLTELAAILKYDVYWLSRAIKRHTKETFKELLRTKRLNQASYLLTHTRLSVAEIIAAVGYDNTSYFHRIFKERFLMSPKEYRISQSANQDVILYK